MHDLNFVVREPLLDTKQQIIGYELTVQQSESDREIVTPADDFRALASYITHALQDEEGKWLLKSHRIFLRAEPSLLECDEIQALPAKRVVLSVRLDDLADLKTLASVKKLRAKGLGIALRDATAIAVWLRPSKRACPPRAA